MFELNEDEKDMINLKIINYTYFPNIKDKETFKKLSEKKNQFYSFNKDNKNIISLY